MPFNFYAKTSFTEMCGCGYFGVCLRAQKYRPCPQLSNDSICRRPSTVCIQSYQQQVSNVLCSVRLSQIKKLQCESNE